MRLRYTRPALADLGAILAFIAEHSPQGAQRVQSRIQRSIDLLLIYPLLGRTTDEPGIRRLTITPYPYLVFYEVGDGDIVVHPVRHAARDPTGMPGAG